MISPQDLALATPLTAVAAAVLTALAPRRHAARVALAAAVPVAGIALTLAGLALHDAADPVAGRWIVVDAAGGLLVAVIAVIGLASTATSVSYLRGTSTSVLTRLGTERGYFVVLLLFWALLLAVPLAGNLGAAWLLIEATTAASALLVGFSGKAQALEAGWKYLILTSLGLGVALLGIAILITGLPGGGIDGLTWHRLATFSSGRPAALTAYLLLLAGLAAKIGWAPVHNWLPDAHSQAPPPVSALLSAALLPAVLLVAWRSQRGLAPVIGVHPAREVLLGFGLVSVAVAVPFLWRPMPFKRLLAYSSLEHLGVMALGLGFGSPLALAGVALHIAGHAVAKALGFYSASPLLAHEPRAARRAVSGIGRTSPALGAAIGVSLGTLSGLPPSPLFVSEVLILAGGFASGQTWAAAAAAVLLALGFLGLAHATIETLAGDAPRRDRAALPGLRLVTVLGSAAFVVLVGLAAVAPWLPGTSFVAALVRGVP
ncbi:MAG TPA: proton-conducting transporter membrane subunit [Streptosporangiaceae bacterium]